MTVQPIGPPGATSSASTVLVTARSAGEVGALIESLLLSRFGSEVADVTVAVLDTEPAGTSAATVAVTVTTIDPAGSSASAVQSNAVPPVMAQVPAVGVATTSVNPGGRLSRIVTDCAVDGPALATVSMKVTAWPGTTGSGVTVLIIDRSALAATSVLAVAELLSPCGSGVSEVTEAVFDTGAVAVGLHGADNSDGDGFSRRQVAEVADACGAGTGRRSCGQSGDPGGGGVGDRDLTRHRRAVVGDCDRPADRGSGGHLIGRADLGDGKVGRAGPPAWSRSRSCYRSPDPSSARRPIAVLARVGSANPASSRPETVRVIACPVAGQQVSQRAGSGRAGPAGRRDR